MRGKSRQTDFKRHSLQRIAGFATRFSVRLSPAGNGAVMRSEAPLPQAYTLPFRTPPLAVGTRDADGVTRYGLEQRTAEVEILPGFSTRHLTYGGTVAERPSETVEVAVRFND